MKFPVWRTTMDVFDYCWRERRAVVRFGLIPLGIIIVVSFIAQAMGVDQTTSIPALLILLAVQAVAYLPVSVTWYRMAVLGENEAMMRPVFTLGRLEWRMLWWQVLLIIAVTAFGAVCGFMVGVIVGFLRAAGLETAATVTATVLGLGILVAILLFVCRLSMILVLAALDRPVSFKTSWRMTNGLGWRLLGALTLTILAGVVLVVFFRLMAFLIGAVTAMTAGGTLQQIVPYLALLGQNIAGLFIFLAGATLLGFVYKILTAAAPAETPAL